MSEQEIDNRQTDLEKLQVELHEAEKELDRLPDSTNARMRVVLLKSSIEDLKNKRKQSGK